MAEKNRFSRLLKHLLTVAEMKNYALAQQLRYDVSYISKWTSGQMIPPEKNAQKILEGISRAVVDSCSPEALARLRQDYQLEDPEDLKLAVLDNLVAEYDYVRELQTNTGMDVAPRTAFFPELKLTQYAAKMRHPVLRRVSALEIVGVMDLFGMTRECQLMIAESENKHLSKGMEFPDVHYSMLIDIQPDKMDPIRDPVFLVDLLERNSCIDFRLYGDSMATGRAMFVVKDEYAITGMLAGQDRCLSVVISEDPANCEVLYRNLIEQCNRDRLLFRKISMEEMLAQHSYIHALLSLRQRWIIGHLTEHFLPDDLFEELLAQQAGNLPDPAVLRETHSLTRKVVEESDIQLLLYSTALYNLVVDRELDFYNRRVQLTNRQVRRCLEDLYTLCRDHPGLEVKMIAGRLLPDMEFGTRHCLFLGDALSCLRLDGMYNNVFLIHRLDMRRVYERAFAAFWNNDSHTLIENKALVLANIEHVLGGIPEEETAPTAENSILFHS